MSFPARKKIGRYEICSQLGAGGMGEVYLANDTKLDRKVALKILPTELGENTGDRVRRFVQEAKAASALNHPNILTIYEIDEVDSEPLLPYLPDGPRELERVVMRALRKDREERYQTVKDFLVELKDLKRELDSQSQRISGSRSFGSFSTEAVPEKSIAVLYFENMNSEKESDYICAGMTEDIITDLSKIKELKVVSRTDVLPFRNKEVNTRNVGDALRVNYILEGSVGVEDLAHRYRARTADTETDRRVPRSSACWSWSPTTGWPYTTVPALMSCSARRNGP